MRRQKRAAIPAPLCFGKGLPLRRNIITTTLMQEDIGMAGNHEKAFSAQTLKEILEGTKKLEEEDLAQVFGGFGQTETEYVTEQTSGSTNRWFR